MHFCWQNLIFGTSYFSLITVSPRCHTPHTPRSHTIQQPRYLNHLMQFWSGTKNTWYYTSKSHPQEEEKMRKSSHSGICLDPFLFMQTWRLRHKYTCECEHTEGFNLPKIRLDVFMIMNLVQQSWHHLFWQQSPGWLLLKQLEKHSIFIGVLFFTDFLLVFSFLNSATTKLNSSGRLILNNMMEIPS